MLTLEYSKLVCMLAEPHVNAPPALEATVDKMVVFWDKWDGRISLPSCFKYVAAIGFYCVKLQNGHVD